MTDGPLAILRSALYDTDQRLEAAQARARDARTDLDAAEADVRQYTDAAHELRAAIAAVEADRRIQLRRAIADPRDAHHNAVCIPQGGHCKCPDDPPGPVIPTVTRGDAEVPDFVEDTESARAPGWGNRGPCPYCDAYQHDGAEIVTEDAMHQHFDVCPAILNATDVACPTCKVGPGIGCLSLRYSSHGERHVLYRRVFDHLTHLPTGTHP